MKDEKRKSPDRLTADREIAKEKSLTERNLCIQYIRIRTEMQTWPTLLVCDLLNEILNGQLNGIISGGGIHG